MSSAEIRVFGALEPDFGVQGTVRSVDGGGVAGPRDRPPDLAPAKSPLAWPLPPTGGDALTPVTSQAYGRVALSAFHLVLFVEFYWTSFEV